MSFINFYLEKNMEKDISFGLFLTEKKWISEEALLDALDYQSNYTLHLGKVCIMRRDLSHQQVLEILKRQQELKDRKSFGEVAVQMGYLSEKQVKAILEHQKMFRESLSEVLVNLGKIKMEKMEEALSEYESQMECLPQDEAEDIQGEPLSVLVVDDETPICINIATLLKLNGHHAETATSAFEALQKMEKQEFHVIVSDVRMPEMNGLSLLSKIQDKAPFTETILITGNVEEDLAKNSLQKGAFGFIAKPVKFSNLLEMIQAAGKNYSRKKDIIAMNTKESECL